MTAVIDAKIDIILHRHGVGGRQTVIDHAINAVNDPNERLI
jgi:hypothetical protein